MAFAIKDNTIDDIRNFKISLHSDGNFKMPGMHYHNAYEIYILENGERFYMLEEKLICLKPRDVLLIRRNEIHCTIGGTYRKSAIEFTESYLQKFFTPFGINLATKCFEKTIIRVRESDFPKLLSTMEKLAENNEDMLALVQLFNILENNMSRKNYDLQDTSAMAANIVDYITDNYKTIESLNEIANNFYISKQHLCNLFKQYTGTTVIKYINVLKVHASFEHLFKKGLSISEVAEKSGFCNAQYYSQTFKSVTGVSPLNYRKNKDANKF